ncbi:hypothetical protein [Candidatus Corynebacterium faecigallinarum]|uniref:hypothetical protein n=1 Tax=Candidatus Corynebacterium faecigallinarum TaxID=2838528 RepID=UPI003FD385CC
MGWSPVPDLDRRPGRPTRRTRRGGRCRPGHRGVLTTELNGTYHDEAGVRTLLSELVGYEVDATVGLFPSFTSDFGRSIRFGKNVFINAGCRFQDQGGLMIGDGALIGHNTVIATLNHAMDPARRAGLEPAPVVIAGDAHSRALHGRHRLHRRRPGRPCRYR